MFKSLSAGALSLSVPFEEALRLASANGFAGLDLPTSELLRRSGETLTRDLTDLFGAVGLRPGAWSLPVDFRGDDATFDAGLADLPRHAALARALGSPWCATWILPYSDERDYDDNMRRHVTRLRPVAQILADHGCRLGLEFVGPRTLRAGHAYDFIHTIDGALELGARIGVGNTGLLLDCFHWYTSRGTVDDLARLRAEQIVYAHVNDAPAGRDIDEQKDKERLLPGASGVIDIVGFLQSLDRMGYDGPVAVEPFDAAVQALPPEERVRAAGASLARVWGQAGLDK